MANYEDSHRTVSRHLKGRKNGKSRSFHRDLGNDKGSRESRKRRSRDRCSSRSNVEKRKKTSERNQRYRRTPSSSPSPARRSSSSTKSRKSSHLRARARRSKERSSSESSEKSINIRSLRQEPISPIITKRFGKDAKHAMDGLPLVLKASNLQESSFLDTEGTSRTIEATVESPSSPNPGSEALYLRALKAHGVPELVLTYPDGFQKMSLAFAGRISVVKEFSDLTCRKIALRMVQKWQQANETYLSLSTRYLNHRQRELKPDPNNNNNFKVFPPMMNLRHELHGILASRVKTSSSFSHSELVDLTLFYFNHVADHVKSEAL